MTALLQQALQQYRSGDFQGLLRRHAPMAARRDCPQIMLVLLAQSHLKTGDELKAAEHYRLAGLAKGENHASYLKISGSLFRNLSLVEEAYDAARRAMALAPDDPHIQAFYHATLLETCLFEEIDAALTRLQTRLDAQDPDACRADSPFSNITWCGDEADNARIVPPTVAHPVTATMRGARHGRPHLWSDRLRIGYLSDDYYDTHATMHLFKGVMDAHDADRFDVTYFCYTKPANVARDRGTRRRHANLVEIGHLGDQDAASLIRSHGVDIAVDLKGHTNGARSNLVNLGLAPVQVAWLGYPGSGNGIDCDYVISDRIVTPDSAIPHYHEKLCRLPETYQPNDDRGRPRPAPVGRAALGLPEDRIVLGFFNATRKLTPQTFASIVAVLDALPDAVLWILFFNRFAEGNFRAAITARGIDPARVITAPKALYTDHIARLGAVDIGLDSFPYNGHTTTSDLLWAGVPVATCRGTHFASRVSESLLTALGVPELVAEDTDSYVGLVRTLATDREKRLAVRAGIDANRMTRPLFDTQRFTRHLERAYEAMAARARNGLPSELIDIAPLPL